MRHRRPLRVRFKTLPQAIVVAVLLAVAFTWLAVPVRAVSGPAKDTKGTDFWLAFMQNYDPAQNATLPLTLTLFITGETDTSGTVTLAGQPAIPFVVHAGQVTSVLMPETAQLTANDTVESKGIHVTALDDVTVYGLNRRPESTDAYLGLPTDILGEEYITLGYVNSSFSNPANQTEFAIVGTEAGTTVTITPTVTSGAHTAGTPYSITLNAGDTYQLQNAAAGLDLSGTIITASHPVAVFGGHSCADVPQDVDACDALVEELPPTSTWGKSFVTMPLATREFGDTFRFLAQQTGTTVTVNGSVVTPPGGLSRGQVFEYIIDGPAQVTANQPILVAQYSNGTFYDGLTSDPFMVLVPPFEQFQAGYTVTTPATGFTANFLNLVVPTVSTGLLQLDGAAIAPGDIVGGAFTPIGTSGFSGGQVRVSLGSHTVAGALPLGITVYGFADFDSYGYPGGMSLAPIAVVTTLQLLPRTAVNPVNTQHCVVGTLTDQFGGPVVGVRVDFRVQGVHSVLGFSSTDDAGQAQFCYVGTQAGEDTITGSQGSLSDVVAATWVAGVIDAVDDGAGPVVGAVAHPGVIANVLANDLLNGVHPTVATVTLTTSVADPTGALTLNADGSADLAVTAAGAHALTYRICETSNPSNCDTATATVTASAAVIDAVDDNGAEVSGSTGGTSLANVLANDTLNGTAVDPARVVLTFVSSTNAGVTLNVATRAVNVAAGTAAGGYSLNYRICEILNPANCDTATVTVPVAPAAPGPGCVREADYWLSHPDEWPVSSLTLGSVTYTKAQLLKILEYAARQDGHTKNGIAALAADLIVARLNQAAGAMVPASVAAAMAEADTLIGASQLPPIGPCALPSGPVNRLDGLLDAYNAGKTQGGPSSCRDCASLRDDDTRTGGHDKDGRDGKDDRNGKDKDDRDTKDGRDSKNGRDGKDGNRDRDDAGKEHGGENDHGTSDVACRAGPGGGHHEGDSCVAGHHGHTVGDHCQGAGGVHHDGDGCDARNGAHGLAMKKVKGGN